MSENNTATTLKVIFWGTLLFIGSIIIMAYLPIIKANLPVIPVTHISTENTVLAENEKIPPDVFSIQEVKNSNVIVNSYLDGIVFNSTGNYIITLLKDDMGCRITSVEENGVEPKEWSFLGQGWYTTLTIPVIEELPITDTNMEESIE